MYDFEFYDIKGRRLIPIILTVGHQRKTTTYNKFRACSSKQPAHQNTSNKQRRSKSAKLKGDRGSSKETRHGLRAWGRGTRKLTYSQLCSNSTSESLKVVKTGTLTLPLCVWHRLWRQEQGRHVQRKTVSITSGARIFCSSFLKREPTWLRPEALRLDGKQQQQKYCLVSK